jgi:hypothetical protein
MQHGCAVCQSFRPQANLRDRTLTRVTFGDRTIVLCEAHRRIAESSGATTYEALRDLYAESDGRRSYVPRRECERWQLDRRSSNQ